jgi:hypothetical protein
MNIVKRKDEFDGKMLDLSVEKCQDNIIMKIHQSKGDITLVDILEHEALFYSDLIMEVHSDGWHYLVDNSDNSIYKVDDYHWNKFDDLIKNKTATFEKIQGDIEDYKELFED